MGAIAQVADARSELTSEQTTPPGFVCSPMRRSASLLSGALWHGAC